MGLQRLPRNLGIPKQINQGLRRLGIDIGSSTVARGVVSLVLGYLNNLVIELAFLIQVADFGLAKLSSDANTRMSTRVMGIFGYNQTDRLNKFILPWSVVKLANNKGFKKRVDRQIFAGLLILLKTALGLQSGSTAMLSPAQDLTFQLESVKCLVRTMTSMGAWMDHGDTSSKY